MLGKIDDIKRLPGPCGSTPVLIADERVAERFTAPADEVERFMYGWSVLHCLPATIDESDAVANGTVLREGTVGDWARQAGFGHVQTLPIDNDFWRFYRLDARAQPTTASGERMCDMTSIAASPAADLAERMLGELIRPQDANHDQAR